MGHLGNIHAQGKGKAQKWVTRILSHSESELGDECIPWPFYIAPDGYGRLEIEGQGHTHHRGMWLLRYGLIEPGKVVRHKCRLKSCANPNHHELGTVRQNILDKQRDRTQTHGEAIHCSKLTPCKVRELHARVARGEPSVKVADLFNVSCNTVNAIIKGKTWKHLKLRKL